MSAMSTMSAMCNVPGPPKEVAPNPGLDTVQCAFPIERVYEVSEAIYVYTKNSGFVRLHDPAYEIAADQGVSDYEINNRFFVDQWPPSTTLPKFYEGQHLDTPEIRACVWNVQDHWNNVVLPAILRMGELHSQARQALMDAHHKRPAEFLAEFNAVIENYKRTQSSIAAAAAAVTAAATQREENTSLHDYMLVPH